ncbi:MAG: 1-acyl-sn-glycerol-3-phosphate acyltransferase [Alphaproteobacteria bacterium]|nr:1-acyl-sn-glycerol-3-phosphate acyltransferase [Alphaproteobacteria bacterium]
MTILRSTLFLIYFALISAALNIGCIPLLAFPRRVAKWAPDAWCGAVLWGLRHIAGLDYRVRGTVPPPGVLIAPKHMSMWDTVAIWILQGHSVFVLKRELLNIPLYGWYARKMGMIAIDRDGKASALRKMVEAAKSAFAHGYAVVIFPEGTRKKPGSPTDYKPGVAALYGHLGVPCVPVALNSGLFWTGPGGFLKKAGTITIEFLEPIPPGLKRAEFMRTLETRIETATTALVEDGRAQLVTG